jgi:hypothetical protein
MVFTKLILTSAKLFELYKLSIITAKEFNVIFKAESHFVSWVNIKIEDH